MKNIMLLMLLIASGAMLAQLTGRAQYDGDSAYKRIGPVHREIAETSPVAKLVIEQAKPEPGIIGLSVAIRATLHNTSDHKLSYLSPTLVYDVRDNKSGKRVPDTPTGCYTNFFSECYTPSAPRGIPSTGFPRDIVPVHSSVELKPLSYIDMNYELGPGEYTVVGVYCAKEPEGPECFKSNTITIKIPPTD